MSQRKLRKIQSLVRTKNWTVGVHVQEYLENGDFDETDIECSIRTGRITVVERDELRQAIDSYKYTIVGVDAYGLPFATCGKIIDWVEGHYYFLITAYKET